MGVFEKYWLRTAALRRVAELLDQGKKVSSWRDIEDGQTVWKVEWK